MLHTIPILFAAGLASQVAAASASPESPHFELSAGVGFPRSGALERTWEWGPGLGVHWLLADPRGTFTSLGLRYEYFDRPEDQGAGAHHLWGSAALHARPAVLDRLDLQVGAGWGALWTGSPVREELPLECPDCPAPAAAGEREFDGLGASVETGLGLVVSEGAAALARTTLRARWIRTWVSDTSVDYWTVEAAFGLR